MARKTRRLAVSHRQSAGLLAGGPGAFRDRTNPTTKPPARQGPPQKRQPELPLIELPGWLNERDEQCRN